MQWPFEQYAKALLITMPAGEALDRLIEAGFLPHVDEMPGTPHPAYARLATLRRKLLSSRPAGCTPGSIAEEVWFRVNKVASYCLNEPDARSALALLGQAKTRYVLETLLVGGLPVPLICEQVNRIYGTSLVESVVGLYAHYFWDRDNLGPEDWRSYLVVESMMGMRVSLQDAYPNGRVLLQVLHSPPGVALWRAGIVTTFDAESVLNNLINWGVTRFSETAIEPNTAGTAIKMERYAKIVLEALDRRSSMGGAIQDQIKRAYTITKDLRKLEIGDARKLLNSQQATADFLRSYNTNEVREVR